MSFRLKEDVVSWKRFSAISLVLILCFYAVMSISARGIPSVVQTNLEKLPLEIGGYKGVDDSFPESVYEVLDADLHVYRHYRTPDGYQADLYIGYYGTAKGGRTGHNPYACLPGAGWGVVESAFVTVKPNYYTNGVDINYTLSRKGDVYNLMLHWYQSDKTKVLSTGFEQNLQRLKGKILFNRNDGAYVQTSLITTYSDHSDLKKNLVRFTTEVMDLLPLYWPVEGVNG